MRSFKALISLLAIAAEFSAVDCRTFSAAPKHEKLRRRDLSLEARREGQVLVFADNWLANGQESAARVSLNPKIPTLILEDIDDHVRGVSCNGAAMVVHFHSRDTMLRARDAWENEPELLFVTTASGCSLPGAHGAYRVSFAEADDFSSKIRLHAVATTIKDSTHNMWIDIGSHVVEDLSPRYRRVKRAALPQSGAASSAPMATSTSYQRATLTPTTTLSFPTPVGTGTGPSATGDISFSHLNTTLLPPDPSIAALLPGTSNIDFFRLSCQNCTMTGTIDLLAGGFSVNSSAIGAAMDFFEHGFISFSANNMNARMAFELDFLPGFSVPIFSAKLPTIPLTPIIILGVLEFGPELRSEIPIAVTLGSTVTMNTGFDLAVPNNSTIVLNVSDITSSYSTGFANTQLTQLPFNASADDLTLNFTVGFKPALVFGASLGPRGVDETIEVGGGIGVFMDIPKLVASVDVVRNTNDTCEGTAPRGVSNSFVRVIPSVQVDGGVLWELNATVLDFGYSLGGEQELFGQSLPLPTQCLKLSQNGGLVAATASPTSGSRSDDRTGNAVRGTVNSALAAILAIAVGVLVTI